VFVVQNIFRVENCFIFFLIDYKLSYFDIVVFNYAIWKFSVVIYLSRETRVLVGFQNYWNIISAIYNLNQS